MARKKDKIRVNLELPKDDKTQSNFHCIIASWNDAWNQLSWILDYQC